MPAELTEAALLLRTGWTWPELEEAPDDLVEKMLLLLNSQAVKEDDGG